MPTIWRAITLLLDIRVGGRLGGGDTVHGSVRGVISLPFILAVRSTYCLLRERAVAPQTQRSAPTCWRGMPATFAARSGMTLARRYSRARCACTRALPFTCLPTQNYSDNGVVGGMPRCHYAGDSTTSNMTVRVPSLPNHPVYRTTPFRRGFCMCRHRHT